MPSHPYLSSGSGQLLTKSFADSCANDLFALLTRLGFAERIRGSHHIFTREDVDENSKPNVA